MNKNEYESKYISKETLFSNFINNYFIYKIL